MKKEAGVKDVLEFYARIDEAYAAALKALKDGRSSLVSNSANSTLTYEGASGGTSPGKDS